MKLPPALEPTLLEPPIVGSCPAVCCFNRTCGERTQRGMAPLWIDGTLTADNYQVGCYRYEYLVADVRRATGLTEPPSSADALYEVLMERLAMSEPAAPTPVELQHTDPEALALREKVMKLRDAARQRRDAATKAAYDAVHPQQELGV